jgi:hypothetical protein
MNHIEPTAQQPSEQAETRGAGPVLQRLVYPEDLICPGCREQVCCEPPAYWTALNGHRAPEFSHRDGSPLCWQTDGKEPAEPIEREVWA